MPQPKPNETGNDGRARPPHTPSMSNENDKNYVSVWSWMWMMFVMALPCIGLIMVLVWAFTGDNESRKNYFKAILMWFVLVAVLVAITAAIGGWPQMQKQIQDLIHKK